MSETRFELIAYYTGYEIHSWKEEQVFNQC